MVSKPKPKPKMFEVEEAVALELCLRCPICDDGLDEDVYLIKYNNKIMITCLGCGENVAKYLHIKYWE